MVLMTLLSYCQERHQVSQRHSISIPVPLWGAEYHLVNEAIVNVMATIKFESWLEAERNNSESTINAMSAMQDGPPKLEVDYGECLKLLTPEGMKTWAHLPR